MQTMQETELYDFLKEINENNSTNYKLEVLGKYKDSEIVKRVLKMAYDKVSYNYGIGKTTLQKMEIKNLDNSKSIFDALDFIENKLSTRELTGHAAINALSDIFKEMNPIDIDITIKIIERDLRINVGKTNINKIFKDLIVKPSYMRCDVLTKKTSKNIHYPAVLQKKADGTYREFSIDDGEVECRSRSGESYDYPLHNNYLSKLKDGVYVGELTVRASEETMKTVYKKLEDTKRKGDDTEELEEIISKYNESISKGEEYILPRGIGNGLINSDEPPHEDIVIELWDYITFEEYNLARQKDKKKVCTTIYNDRFNILKKNISEISYNDIRIIEHVIVNNSHEVMLQNKIWMEKGYEGSILKDWSGVFKDGTSNKQLKIKLKISVEMRIVGFKDGTIGTKREGKVGSIIFKNDEGTVDGRCSGFTDEFLDEVTNNKEKYLGKIIEVEFNDLSRASGSETYALSHPRFIEFRLDKSSTDKLEQIFKMREMAMDVSSYFEK